MARETLSARPALGCGDDLLQVGDPLAWLAPHRGLRLVWLMLSVLLLALFATLHGSWRFVG